MMTIFNIPGKYCCMYDELLKAGSVAAAAAAAAVPPFLSIYALRRYALGAHCFGK